MSKCKLLVKLYKIIPLSLGDLAKMLFWSILSSKNWSFANFSAFGASHFRVSFSHERKFERIEKKIIPQNLIYRLSKNSASRRGQVKYFRDRICDFNDRTVYCCKGQIAPRTNAHLSFLRAWKDVPVDFSPSEQPSRPSTTRRPIQPPINKVMLFCSQNCSDLLWEFLSSPFACERA